MRPPIVCLVLVLLSLAAGPRADAQLADITPGVRVRFRVPERFGAPVSGTVLERHGDTLKVSPPKGEALFVRLGEMERVEISRGESRLLGAGVGALWGAGIYAGLGLAVGIGDCNGCEYDVDAFKATVAFGLSGAIAGAMIGAMVGKERWERLRWPVGVGAGVGVGVRGVSRGGVEVGVRW